MHLSLVPFCFFHPHQTFFPVSPKEKKLFTHSIIASYFPDVSGCGFILSFCLCTTSFSVFPFSHSGVLRFHYCNHQPGRQNETCTVYVSVVCDWVAHTLQGYTALKNSHFIQRTLFPFLWSATPTLMTLTFSLVTLTSDVFLCISSDG